MNFDFDFDFRCWFLIDLTIKLMMIIKLLLDVSTLSLVFFKSLVEVSARVPHLTCLAQVTLE